MREMSIRELRDSLASIDDIVNETGDVVVTRRGSPVVRLTSVKPRPETPTHLDLRAAMPRMKDASEVLMRPSVKAKDGAETLLWESV